MTTGAHKTAATAATTIRLGLGAACGVVLAFLLALVVTTGVQRYLFGSGFLGAEEAAAWLLLLITCLGFPLVAGGSLSMAVDLFPARGGALVAALRATLCEAFVLAAALGLLVAATRAALQIGGVSPLLGLGEWLRPAALAASGLAALGLRGLVLASEGRGRRLIAALLFASAFCGLIGSGVVWRIESPSLAAGGLILSGLLVAAPLPHVFIVAGFGAIPFGSPLTEPAVAASLASGAGRSLLIAIPFFLLAGGLLIVSGMAGDLVRFAASLVGRRRSGLGQTVLLTSVLFSGTSGSSIANAAFSAKTFLEPLVAGGYRPERAAALIASTAVLDNVIPPSIAFFILATATNLPIGPLLAGGLFAGLAMAIGLSLAIRFGFPETGDREFLKTSSRAVLALKALPVFGLGLIVVAGIRFGFVTPTEAAGFAAAYVLVVAFAKRGSAAGIGPAFTQAGAETAAIVTMIGAATPLAFLLAADGVAASAASFATGLGENPLMVLLAANLLLLGVGLLLDIGAAILLFGPILLPVAVAAGIDPVHFGVILVVNLMIGGLTPPVGILVQVVSASTGILPAAIFRSLVPGYAALLGVLLTLSLGAAAHGWLSAR